MTPVPSNHSKFLLSEDSVLYTDKGLRKAVDLSESNVVLCNLFSQGILSIGSIKGDTEYIVCTPAGRVVIPDTKYLFSDSQDGQVITPYTLIHRCPPEPENSDIQKTNHSQAFLDGLLTGAVLNKYNVKVLDSNDYRYRVSFSLPLRRTSFIWNTNIEGLSYNDKDNLFTLHSSFDPRDQSGIPWFYHYSTQSTLLGFLSGIFTGAGSVNKMSWLVELELDNREAAYQILEMLSYVNIWSSIRKKNNKYSLLISDYINEFKSRIGFADKQRSDILSNIIAERRNRFGSSGSSKVLTKPYYIEERHGIYNHIVLSVLGETKVLWCSALKLRPM